MTERFILGGFSKGLPTPETPTGALERHNEVVVRLLIDSYNGGRGPLSAEDYSDAVGRVWASRDLDHLRQLAAELLLPLGFNLTLVDELLGTSLLPTSSHPDGEGGAPKPHNTRSPS